MRKETVLLCSIFSSLLRSRALFILYCDNKGSVVIIFPLLCNYPDNERPLIYRSPHHFLVGFLRVPGGKEMVGAILQAALAGHHCLLPGRSGGDQRAGGGEGAGQDGEEDGGQVVQPSHCKKVIIMLCNNRYCILAYILCIRKMSTRLRKRFPSIHELVKTGIIRADEVR